MFKERNLVSRKHRTGLRLDPKSIIIHVWNGVNEEEINEKDVKWVGPNSVFHWVVDDQKAVQRIPDEEMARQTERETRNPTALHIGINVNETLDPVARYDHAVSLAAYLLHKHKLSIDELFLGENGRQQLFDAWPAFKSDVRAILPSIMQNKTHILGESIASAEQMKAYVQKCQTKAKDYVDLYVQMEEKEGVRADVAFAQSLLETNDWRFDGVVSPKQNNFAGLGRTKPDQSGGSFNTPEEGIIAQMRRLKWYAAYPVDFKGESDDQHGVPEHLQGWAPFVEELSGKWTSDPFYGIKIKRVLKEIQMTAPIRG